MLCTSQTCGTSYSTSFPLPRRTYFFGKQGPGPLRSVGSHSSILISSEVGPGGESCKSVMLPRSFICILSCPLFPVVCFPSWRQIYPSNLENIFCFFFLFFFFCEIPCTISSSSDFLCTKTTFAFPSAYLPLSHPSFKPSFSNNQLPKQVTVLFFPQ